MVRDDAGAGTASPCECRQRQRVPRLLAECGVPELYRGCRVSSFRVRNEESLQRARSVAARYVEDFLRPDGTFEQTGLLFVGRAGSGKTHLATAILQELIERYSIWGRFVDFTALVHEIQATFDPSTSETQHGILEPVMHCELLVLDELGARKPTPWVMDILYLILNTRYSRRLPTLFTTNYFLDVPPKRHNLDRALDTPGLETLSSRIPFQLVSRLHQMAVPVVLTPEDDAREKVFAAKGRFG